MIWRISELVPNRVVSMELMAQATGRVLGVRRDSLVAVGDSTMVVSTVVSRLLRDTTRSATAEVAGDMMLSMFRLQAKLELQGLKGRIEGPSTQKTSR
jgi:hypothetical protein